MDKKMLQALGMFLMIALIVYMIATHINAKNEMIPEKLIEHQQMLRDEGILK